MVIYEDMPLLEDILNRWREHIGRDYAGYRNHVYRMTNFCFALHDCAGEEREKVIIAGCFHDLGIWTGATFDYLPPWVALAKEYLTHHQLDRWVAEITLMIEMHHKLSRFQDDRYPLVELFRRGDLIDFSMGFVKCGLPVAYIKRVKECFPNAGFHKRLVQLEFGWFPKHPLNPAPVFKWQQNVYQLSRRQAMSFITAQDGARIYYKDWGNGQAVVFSHGWPLSADAWDGQMLFLGQRGYRVIAHDRRSHGRSDQTWDGNNMDTYADDLAKLIETLDLRNAVLVGHSTGGGEVVHDVGRYGTSRVAKVVLVGAVPPLMLKTAANPNATALEAFDAIRKGVLDNRAQFFKDLTLPFYGYNRDGAKASEGVRESFWLQGMMVGVKGAYDCIHEFSEVDYSEDLKKMHVPTLIVHGDDDQIVPIRASALRAVEIAPQATLKVYPGGSHGLPTTQQDQFNADLLAFITG